MEKSNSIRCASGAITPDKPITRAILSWVHGPDEPPELCIVAGSDDGPRQIGAILSRITKAMHLPDAGVTP